MKIFDCFMYFDEDMLLELRLNTLSNIVDKFIIIESPVTHTGLKKELKFNIKNFKKFSHKINYFPIKNFIIDDSLKIKKNWSKHHLVDQTIRNYISTCLGEADKDDWIIISDIDEIPNPQAIKKFNPTKKFAFFEQELYCYKFNLKNISEPYWYGSRICVKKYLKSPQWLRNIKIKKNQSFIKKIFNNFQVFENGGWHFTSIKNPKDLIVKLKSFAHNEIVKNYMLDENFIKSKIDNCEDIFDRKVSLKKVIIDNNFPEFLRDNKQYFKEFII